ncbi:MAG: hypothetical protein LBH30_06875 [Prevotellaceae bacterium]|jgi:hypothetical protein|nr:hypothetical protein [Prevotellaceae bacterium]
MKKLLILLLSAAICFSAAAQQKLEKKQRFGNDKKPNREEIIETKCKKAADKLMLDDATTAKFTPVYKAYLNELSENIKFNKPKTDGEMNDAAIDENMQEYFVKMRKTVDIREKYYKEFRTFLTAKQTKTAMKLFDGKHRKNKQFTDFNHVNSAPLMKRLEFYNEKQKLNKENPSLQTK